LADHAVPGTHGPQAKSAVLIPVPDAEPLVGCLRQRFDPIAPAGVPAHVTLVVPWVQPQAIGVEELRSLEQELEGEKSFEFELTHIGWFGRRVLWLAPEPAEHFVDLAERVARRFGTPPWEGQFDRLVPHLTVAQAASGVELVPVAAELSTRLPLRCRAGEVWVMVGDGTRWEVRHRVSLVS
jgi:2'-5' RNA ligase